MNDFFETELLIEELSALAHAEHAQMAREAQEWIARSIGQHIRRFLEGLENGSCF